MTLVARDMAGCWGIDTDTPITPEIGQRIASTPLPNGQRCSFVLRYVFFGPPRSNDICRAELDLLLSLGFGVALVQHPREPAWNVLTHDRGADDAVWAVRNALAAGYDPARLPAGSLALWLSPDLEGVQNPPASPYTAAWCTYGRAQGYTPAPYCGYACGLDDHSCDTMPGDPSWWVDFGDPAYRPKPARGYRLRQHQQITWCGIGVDTDEALAGDGPGLVCLVDADVSIVTADPAA